MPLKKCQKNKARGYKWGDSGACYTGKSGKAKAQRQGRAVEASKSRKKPK